MVYRNLRYEIKLRETSDMAARDLAENTMRLEFIAMGSVSSVLSVSCWQAVNANLLCRRRQMNEENFELF